MFSLIKGSALQSHTFVHVGNDSVYSAYARLVDRWSVGSKQIFLQTGKCQASFLKGKEGCPNVRCVEEITHDSRGKEQSKRARHGASVKHTAYIFKLFIIVINNSL